MRLRRRRPASEPEVVAAPPGEPLLPPWAARAAASSVVVLLVAAVAWLALHLALQVALVTFSLALALVAVALLAPLVNRLHRLGLPTALAALLCVLLLIGLLVGVGLLVYSRATGEVDDLAASLTAGIDQIRGWLVSGPLALDPAQVDSLRDTIVRYLEEAVPSPVAGATMALQVLAAAFLAVFAVFFLLKDCAKMWAWFLTWVPAQRRRRVDEAGHLAWSTLTGYVAGIVVVALVDAAFVGTALFALGVPLWLSLTLLTFLGAFVPVLGATVSGAVAVLVTLVTNGPGDAVIVLVVVLAVQQLEGNVLHPLIVGRAVRLHPLVVLIAVTCGTLLLGIPGAIIAVPVVAVAYRVAAYLGHHSSTAS